MSSDQRPGKVRVYSSGANGVQPRRRRGDMPDVVVELAVTALTSPTTIAPVAGSSAARSFPRLAALFLLGSALGGAVIAWLGLMPGSLQ